MIDINRNKNIRIILIITGVILSSNCFCQLDCKMTLKDYKNTIDTSQRPVYLFVDSMPNILSSNNIANFFTDKIQVIDSSKCFPLYIYYGFVVEKDSSISNVFICPQLDFCEDYDNLEIEQQKMIDCLTKELLKVKTKPGQLNKEKVAVYTVGRIHFDPQ